MTNETRDLHALIDQRIALALGERPISVGRGTVASFNEGQGTASVYLDGKTVPTDGVLVPGLLAPVAGDVVLVASRSDGFRFIVQMGDDARHERLGDLRLTNNTTTVQLVSYADGAGVHTIYEDRLRLDVSPDDFGDDPRPRVSPTFFYTAAYLELAAGGSGMAGIYFLPGGAAADSDSVLLAAYNNHQYLALANGTTGIRFQTTQHPDTDANVLDDYEEGTWTPYIGASSGTTAYAVQDGAYVKVGKLVAARFHIVMSGTGTLGGNISISGFPFVSAAYTAGTLAYASPLTGTLYEPTFLMFAGGSYANLYKATPSGRTQSVMTVSDLQNVTTDFIGAVTYIATN